MIQVLHDVYRRSRFCVDLTHPPMLIAGESHFSEEACSLKSAEMEISAITEEPPLFALLVPTDFEAMASDSNDQGLKTVAGIVVSYNPPVSIRAHVAALRPQVRELVIIDNGSGAASRILLEEIASVFHCHVIFNEKNLGIAAALNRGVVYAEEKQCSFAALFDQDSCVTDSFIKSLLDGYVTHSGPRQPAIVIPTFVDERSGRSLPSRKDKEGFVITAMTSGSLIPMSSFRQNGLFEESFFIDHVDTEYSLRVRGNGFVILESDSAILLHSLGELRSYRILGKTFFATNHSAARRYYMSRNRIILFCRYRKIFPGWVSREIWEMVKETIKIVLVEDDRVRKLWATLVGIRDAMIGRTGYRAAL